MGLTKPRASQIYDIDYKQATRVITTTNITLTGGAPNQVDGVNLSLDDRVLVIGQNTGSQNGIYFVDVIGTGSNGTWVRTGDTDITGELLAGAIVMVTEGVIYADTQWKLTSDNPIVIGTTPLTFEQNSAFAFGNVNANGTAVLATSVGDVLTLTAGNNIQITGNNTSKSVTIGVTGISLNSISNGTSNVNVVSSGGNVTVGIGGTGNVAVFATTGEYVTGLLSVTGNVTGGNLVTTNNLTLSNVNINSSTSAIQGWSYPTVSLSVAETAPTGLFFGNAGSSFYVVGTTNDRVLQYNMSTTNMANTGTLFGNVSIAQDTAPNDLFINSSGANLYVLGQTNDTVYQYTLATPWNITTASYASLSVSVGSQEATPTGLWFKPDLSTMYVVGTTNDTVYQYTLSTPGNVATATYASKSFSVANQESGPNAVNLSSDGSKMWIMGSTNTAIFEFDLATPWDVSTATFIGGSSYSVRLQESTPTGLFVDLSNTKVWIVGSGSDTVFQYNTANSVIATANAVGIQGQLAVQGNAYFAQQTVFGGAVGMDSTLSVDSTLTGSSGISFTTTTSNINIGTSQSTGLTTIGGTTQTGAINIGRSTGIQTIAIGNGITASGSTKTIDIGTLGAANSNTNINIGPVAGNSTVQFLANARVFIANTSGLALSVAGNVTGSNVLTGGLISATGNLTVGGDLNLVGNIVDTGPMTLITSSNGNITLSPNGTGNVNTGANVSATGNITGGNITIAGTANISTFIGNTFFGSVPAQPTWYTIAPLNLNNSLAAATKVQLNLINTGGGAGAGSAIDFYTYQISVAAANAESRIAAIDDGNYSAYLSLQTKTPGSTGTNGLVERVKVDSTGASVVANITGGNILTGGIISATGNITGGNILTAGLISATGNITGGNILGNGAGLTGINAFSNVTVTGGNSAVADSIADTLTLTAGTGISIVVDPATDTITIGTQSSSEVFVDGADFGTVTEPVTLSDDLGLVTDAVTQEADLGALVTSGLIYPDQFVLPSYTTSTLPSAAIAGAMIYVTNESGGPVPAFGDGTNWRRVTDRAIVT